MPGLYFMGTRASAVTSDSRIWRQPLTGLRALA